jgi:mono/diheme cytochrome c family protein
MRRFAEHLSLPRKLALIVAVFASPATRLCCVRTALAAEGQTANAGDTGRVVVSAEAQAQADAIYKDKCVTCHGDNGGGDGPAASNLKPPPIDFHNEKWQKSVTDSTITKAIIFGGRSVGVSGQMAPNPDLENEPAIVAALVEKIRKWGK